MFPQATLHLDTRRTIGEISPLLFGGFAEHMGRCVYGGIYDPRSPLADARGFRRDVLAALRELGYTVVRYPGGNFVSAYDWRDGVGPKAERPRRREMAWQSVETNQFGTDEFIAWCRELNAEPMLAVNLGTGTIQDAADLVEYCNAPTGTMWADRRAAHGHREPHNVKYWCLGNEVDGSWQIAHLGAHDYASKAAQAAHVMRLQDPSIKLTTCGSSSPVMKTYPEWDRVVLETCWEHVDFLSLHYYAGKRTPWDDAFEFGGDLVQNYQADRAGDTASYLAFARRFEAHVDDLAATLRYVKAKRRSRHNVYLSWDEWNIGYGELGSRGAWGEAPVLAEQVFTLEDALVTAQWLNVFLRRCDVLKMACVAQIVNILGPVMTRTDGLVRQTIFYPFMLMRRFAKGQALDVLTRAPQVETAQFGPVPVLDVAASHDPETGEQAAFIVNRSQHDGVIAELVWQSQAPQAALEAWQLAGESAYAFNTFADPFSVTARRVDAPAVQDGRVQMFLPPLTFTVVQFGDAARR